MVMMIDDTDHISGLAGLTLTITRSKNGGGFSTINPSVTDRSNGWYDIEISTTDTDTLGDLCLHVTSTGADPTDICMQVVAYDMDSDTDLGLSDFGDIKDQTDLLPASPAGVGDQMNLANASITNEKFAAGAIDEDVIDDGSLTADKFAAGAITSAKIAAGAITVTQAPNLDAAISTRAPESGGNIGAIKDQTDLLPASPAATGDLMGITDGGITTVKFAAGAINSTVAPNLDAPISDCALEDGGNLAAVMAKTDNLPASPAGVGDEMALTTDYDAAKAAASQSSVNTIDDSVDLIRSTDIPSIQAVVDGIQDTDLPAVRSDTVGIKAKTDLIGASVALETGGNVSTIMAKTNNLPTTPAATGDEMALISTYDAAKVASSQASVDSIQDVVDNIHDTDLPAVQSTANSIQAKTNNLPPSPAATGDAMTLTGAYDAAKDAADQSSVDDLQTGLDYLRRTQTNKKIWDAANSRWAIYDDTGISVIYYLKVYTPSSGNVVLGSNAIASGDKIE